MKKLNQTAFEEQLNAPKQLIKPVKIEEMIQNEKAVEALCESRNTCTLGSNGGIGSDDDILF